MPYRRYPRVQLALAPLVSPRPEWVCLVTAECGMEDPYFALRNIPVRGVPEAAVNVTVEYW